MSAIASVESSRVLPELLETVLGRSVTLCGACLAGSLFAWLCSGYFLVIRLVMFCLCSGYFSVIFRLFVGAHLPLVVGLFLVHFSVNGD